MNLQFVDIEIFICYVEANFQRLIKRKELDLSM